MQINYIKNKPEKTPSNQIAKPEIDSIVKIAVPFFAGLGIIAPVASNLISSTNSIWIATTGLIGAAALMSYLYTDIPENRDTPEIKEPLTPIIRPKEPLGLPWGWYKIASDYDAHQDQRRFLSEAVSYGNEILNNTKYFNRDLDLVLSNILDKITINLEETHPFFSLLAQNQAKPAVTLKPALKKSDGSV